MLPFAYSTGISLSEALIFASTNLQYDDRLFIVHENCKLRIPAEPAAKYYKHKHKNKPNMLVSIALAKFNFLAYRIVASTNTSRLVTCL